MPMKMFRILLLAVLGLLYGNTYGQGHIQPDSLIETLKKPLPDTVRMRTLTELCKFYRSFDFEKSIFYGREGLKYAESKHLNVWIAACNIQLGATYYLNGNHDLALRYYLAAVTLFDSENDKKGAADVYVELSAILAKNNDRELAIEYLTNAVMLYIQSGDRNGEASCYSHIGDLYESKNNTDSALYWYRKSGAIFESLGNELSIARNLNSIGKVYTEKKEYEQALDYLNQSLSIRMRWQDQPSLCQSYTALGECYMARGQYDEAITHFKKSIDIARAIGYAEILQYNYEQTANILQQTGKYKEALEYYNLFQSLKDSVYSSTQLQQIEEMKARFESNKKEQKLALANKENALKDLELRRKNILIAIGFSLVALVAALSYLLYNRYRWKNEAALAAAKIQQAELTTRAVIDTEERERKRIAADLHDSIGQMLSAAKINLSALSNKIQFAGEDQLKFYNRTQEIIDECCREVRTMSHQMMPNMLIQCGLIEAVRELAQKMDSPGMKVNFHAHGSGTGLDASTEIILYRIIQECVNNVMKHSEASLLEIQIICDDNEVGITIEDNGKGFLVSGATQKGGLGIQNIMNRVEYIKGKVNFDSTPGNGTHIYIEVPVQKTVV